MEWESRLRLYIDYLLNTWVVRLLNSTTSSTTRILATRALATMEMMTFSAIPPATTTDAT